MRFWQRFGYATVLLAAIRTSAEPITCQQPGVALFVNAANGVELRGASRETLITFPRFCVRWKPSLDLAATAAKTITAEDGQPGVEITYGDTTALHVTGRFVLHPHYLAVRYDILKAPTDEGTNIQGCMFGRVLAKGMDPGPLAKLGRWVRHSKGGIPYEAKDGLLVPFGNGQGSVMLAFGPDNHANLGWKDASRQHTGLTAMEPGHFRSEFTVLVPPAGWSTAAVAARWHNRPLALALSTPKLYNWWTDAREPMTLTAALANVSQENRQGRLTYWVRDWAGNVVAEKTAVLNLPADKTTTETISFQPTAERGIYFAEVAITDLATGEETFARTNLALLPSHPFHSTPDDSLFGIAAYWPVPTEEDVQNLLDRLGVRWVRSGDTRLQHPGRIANHHSNVRFDQTWTDEKRDTWIREQLQQCVERQNPYWEFANEINMSTAGIAMEGGGIGKALLAQPYDEWVRAIRRVQQETGLTQTKLISFGIAGMDVPFVDKMHELGTWELLDGLALHPGRGNFTPDYPVPHPADPTDLGEKGANFWNYYGAVRTAGSLLRTYGEKPLWLTEVYTPTYPNSSWEDTPRNAPENVVLSYALAKAEGVKCAMYYQLFDSVHFDKLGVNPTDREYFFGLVQRDLSFKPALLGYCAIAEALDQASFAGWAKLSDPATRGLLFTTPRGPLAILWNRADGYVLTERTPDFVTPEPWLDTWKTKTPTALPASGTEVTIINSIGQATTLPVHDGSLTLTLDGAPRLVYGLDTAKLAGR